VGQIAFFAESRTAAGERITELRVGRGDTDSDGVPRTHPVARAGRAFDNSPLGPFDNLQEAMIEDAARVVFLAVDPPTGGPPGQGVYRVFTNHSANVKPFPLYATEAIGGSFTGFDPLPTLGAGLRGVVFSAFTDALGLGFYRDGLEIVRPGEGGISGVTTPLLIHAFQPWFAFAGFLSGSPTEAAVIANGSALEQSQMGQGSYEGLSLSGTVIPVVAYTRSGFPGIAPWELVLRSALGVDVLVDADEDPFESFAPARETSVNTSGEVAFISSPDGDGDTLLVADGGDVIHRVVCADMFATFGSIVFFDLALGPRGLNRHGQIAFLARTGQIVPETSDFQTFLVRADPRPGQGAPPTSCAGQPDGTVCDDGDPITLAVCAAGSCAPDPVNGPPSSCIGLDDETVCDDGHPDTISFCANDECLGFPLPVPEPPAELGALLAAAILAALAHRRPRLVKRRIR
jgi:hypothetical protein